MDLSGLTQPITKLIEVIASGFGAMSRPRRIIKESEAQAHKLRVLTDAFMQMQQLPLRAEFSDENLHISYPEEVHTASAKDPETTLSSRAKARLIGQEEKRHQNIESILGETAKTLSEEKEVSPEPLDEDWIARFFRIAEDISTEQMQTLWGRILAGEVKHPGSFSLRTLDILRNIGYRDAEIFSRVAALRIVASTSDTFIINPDNYRYLEESFGVSISDILLLRELGLCVASDALEYKVAVRPGAATLFTFGSTALILNSNQELRLKNLDIIPFTSAGRELAELVSVNPSSAYIRKMASLLHNEKVTFEIGTIIARNASNVEVNNLRPLTNF